MSLAEEWRVVPTFSQFSVSSIGRVRNDKTGYIFQGNGTRSSGYRSITCTVDGKKLTKLIHVLVAETFISNPENLPIVDHIDRNKLNNNVSNLRWVSSADNSQNCTRSPTNPNKARPVVQKTLMGSVIKEWISVSEAAKELKISKSSIVQCCKGICNNTNGFSFDYVDEPDLPGEQWAILIYRGKWYEISNEGRGRTKTGKVTYGSLGKDRTYYVFDKQNIHRLVAMAFCAGDYRQQVDHIDQNPLNNKSSNLRWVSSKDNNQNRTKTSLTARHRPVKQLSMKKDHIKTFSSITEAATTLQLNMSNISSACQGKRCAVGGFIWEYA